MSEKNNIDRLFQEKFKDFEVAPSDKVWENIQFKMNMKEKKTNLLPFWLRLCSFAAVFLIGFSVATTFIAGPFGLKNPFVNSKDRTSDTEKTTVSGNTTEPDSSITTDSFTDTRNEENNAVVVNESENTGSDTKRSGSTGHNDSDKNSVSSSKEESNNIITASTAAVNTKSVNGAKVTPRKNRLQQTTTTHQSEKAATLHSSHEKNVTSVSEKENSALNPNASEENHATVSQLNNQSSIISNKTAISVVSKPEKVLSATPILSDDENPLTEDATFKNSDADFDTDFNKSKVAYESGNKHIPTASKKETSSTLSSSDTSKGIADKNTSPAISDKNKAIANGANTSKALSVVVDSLAEKPKEVAKKTEEKKAEEEKDSKDKNEKKSRWIVSSSFSPVYMNLNGTGSTLDSKFVENSKSYQTSMSYGVGLQYALNNKWTVRTGINALNFEYSTNNITYYYANNGAGLENVNENGTGSGIVVENPNPKGIAYNDDGMVTTRYQGNINHRINYIEVPMELSYKILNKKFGINVIGGVSSIFLNDNRVSLVSSESNLDIGEANNLNKLHFSTNIGLGLRYNFMKTFQANLEPMFKYQINTYNENAGDFKPYFIGVYSGISFSF